MSEIYSMHKTFFRILTQSDATFDPSPDVLALHAPGQFDCHCGRSFTTPQGLACHKRHTHGEFAPERDLIDGATCPEFFEVLLG